MFNNLLKKKKENLEKEIEKMQKIIDDYNDKIQFSKKSLDYLQKEIKMGEKVKEDTKSEIESYKKELKLYHGIIEMEELGIEYTPPYNDLDKISKEKEKIQEKIADLIVKEEAILTTRIYKIDGSEAKGRKFQKTFCENLLIGFNSYFNNKKKSINEYNFNDSISLIQSKFDKMNKKSSLIGVCINSNYLNLIIDLLKIELDEKIIKNKERERIKEEKHRLREEQKLLEEAEKERKQLENERKAMDIAFNKALTEEEREEIKQKLAEIDKRIEDVDYRVANPKAGWVYIIHSDSLPGMVKIGVSRRLSGPHERVKELSSSSLPTPFMLDAFCFSDDAFELESNLHKYFDKQRINPNKEFFRVTAEEATYIMQNKFYHKAHIVNLEDENSEID